MFEQPLKLFHALWIFQPKEKESKEKVSIPQENETDESGSIEFNPAEKPHVEFKDEPEEVPNKETIAPIKVMNFIFFLYS